MLPASHRKAMSASPHNRAARFPKNDKVESKPVTAKSTKITTNARRSKNSRAIATIRNSDTIAPPSVPSRHPHQKQPRIAKYEQ
jgi:hypothetical protein